MWLHMSKNTILLTRTDLSIIQKILDKFPEDFDFTLVSKGGCGIGRILTMELNDFEIQDMIGKLIFEISGPKNW